MNKLILVVLSLGIFIIEPVIAGGTYRWTDPATGITRLNSSPPSYPIKETQINGNFIDIIIDKNDPKVKALVESRIRKEAEQNRLKAENERLKAEQEKAENERLKEEWESHKAERERINVEYERLKAEHNPQTQEKEEHTVDTNPATSIGRIHTREWEKPWASVKDTAEKYCARVFDSFQLQAVCMENERKGYAKMKQY